MTNHRCCPATADVEFASAAGGDDVTAGSAALLKSSLWLSLVVDADKFPKTRTAAYEPLSDWRLIARAPLVLENHLPIGGSFLLWEQLQV